MALSFSPNTSDSNPWTLNEDNIWVSGNKGVHSSTSELLSDEFTVGLDGGYLSIQWSVSSEPGQDKLSLVAVNTGTSHSTELKKISGTANGTAYTNLIYESYGEKLEAGTYKLSIKYTKDSNTSNGADSGYIKSGSIKNFDDEGSETITLREKSGGFVIYEGTDEITDLWTASKNRNQFVWVPVTNPSRIYQSYSENNPKKSNLYTFTSSGRVSISQDNGGIKKEPGILKTKDNLKHFQECSELQGYSKDIYYKELQVEFDRSMESIKKYGGFYIGRYETGNLSEVTPVVKRMNTDIGNQTWYTMYSRAKKINNNENIQTSMIWGCLWDETLEWLIETGEKSIIEISINSSSWANFPQSIFEFTDIDRFNKN